MAPKITKFLLHHTSNHVKPLSEELGSTLTTRQNTLIFNQEDVGIDAVAVDQNLPILLVQIGTSILNDVLLNKGLGANVITEEVRVHFGLPKPKPAPY